MGGGEVRPVNNLLMTTALLGAAATISSCCLFRENELSTQAGLLSLSSGPHHKEERKSEGNLDRATNRRCKLAPKGQYVHSK
jgi:hypothetical protein